MFMGRQSSLGLHVHHLWWVSNTLTARLAVPLHRKQPIKVPNLKSLRQGKEKNIWVLLFQRFLCFIPDRALTHWWHSFLAPFFLKNARFWVSFFLIIKKKKCTITVRTKNFIGSQKWLLPFICAKISYHESESSVFHSAVKHVTKMGKRLFQKHTDEHVTSATSSSKLWIPELYCLKTFNYIYHLK